jgi:hypothetical protein
MEEMLGIALYNYVYLKLAKMPCFSYYFYVFSSIKLENKRMIQVLFGSRVKGEAGDPNNVYTCK